MDQLKNLRFKNTESIYQFQLFNEEIDNVLDLEVSNKSLSSGQMQKVSFY